MYTNEIRDARISTLIFQVVRIFVNGCRQHEYAFNVYVNKMELSRRDHRTFSLQYKFKFRSFPAETADYGFTADPISKIVSKI